MRTYHKDQSYKNAKEDFIGDLYNDYQADRVGTYEK